MLIVASSHYSYRTLKWSQTKMIVLELLAQSSFTDKNDHRQKWSLRIPEVGKWLHTQMIVSVPGKEQNAVNLM